ncbi:MAG: zinc ribbon domain-containing protein, partial [Candidatus Thermoplasmatota archaeon]|nr:zinc ribbon domain-containing protein [Candidatus Thermoplasmatota archaeon]
GFSPNGTTVLTKTGQEIEAYIEEDGSGLERSGVEYSVSTITGWIEYGVGGYSPWEQVEELDDIGSGLYTASVKVELDEGPFNLVRFRIKDVAGNGWVVSSPIKLEVAVTVSNLPPTALFNIIPATDFIYSGDSIILDGSPSSDPEGRNLSYSWYSDLERYPYGDSIGSGKVLNVSLEKVGSHRLWLMVTDGAHIVTSEEQILVVQDREGTGGEDGQDDDGWDIMEILPYLLLALLIGLLLGAIAVYIFMTRRPGELAQGAVDVQPLVPARFESDYFVPHCPHCGTDAKLSDEYCMKCGTVFSAEDKRRMEKEGKKKKRKGSAGKKRSLPSGSGQEEIDEVFQDMPEDWEGEDLYDGEQEEELEEEDDLYEEDYDEDEEDEQFPDPGDEDIDGEEMEDFDMDEIDDLEDMDLEEIDDEWEVDK